MSGNLLDIIETEDKVYNCVIDYISKRQIIIYDLTGINDATVRLLLIKWKMNFPNLRFSIFKSIYYPNVPLNKPVILSLKSVKYCNRCLKPTKPKRSVVKIVASPDNA
jgi:hypothetical protein